MGRDIIFNPCIKIIFPFIVTLCLLITHQAKGATSERQQLVFGDILAKISLDTELPARESARVIQSAFAIIKQGNKTFSLYDPESEISLLNKTSKPVRDYAVSPDMEKVLDLGLNLSHLTQGYFDITFEMEKSGLADIQTHHGKVSLLNANLKINPTGLVKGYTIDKVLHLLKATSAINAATISLGGDIGHFSRDNTDASVIIHDPTTSSKNTSRTALTTIQLRNNAVSTSGQYARGRHIKNTTHSSSEHIQVTVVANTAVCSDALATAMLFMPLEKIKDMKHKFPIQEIIVVTRDKKVIRL